MIHGEWEPTMNLRFVNPDGPPTIGNLGHVLQQEWHRSTIEYRDYGGKTRRCEGFETKWRDVPLVKP